MIDFERLNEYVQTIEDLLLDVELAIQDLKQAKLDLQEAKEEIGTVKETTGKILSYSSMSEIDKADLVKDIQEWAVGLKLIVGDKVRRGNIAYEVIQPHTTQADWLPENVPALFKLYVPTKTDSGEEVIPYYIKPTGGHDVKKKGEKFLFREEDGYDGKIYESVIDNNSWDYKEYPQGWKLVE